ncbi:MAG: copper resistance protein CopC [Hyphomonadaceae bacterium]
MKRLMMALVFAWTPIATATAQDAHGNNAEVVSIPADDAVLATAPTSLSLTFDHTVVLTSVQVHGPGHTTVPINFTAGNAATSYSIPLPALAAGAYEVHWNANGDGHAMEGTLHFTVQ